MKSRNGSILILTLWTLSLLTIFAIGLGYNISGQLRLADHLQDRLKMCYLAKAGIERGIIELAKDETPGYDSLNEAWSNSEEFFKEVPLGDGYVTVSFRMMSKDEEEGEENGVTTFYGIMDESNKININKVPVQILESLLKNVGGAEDEASDIANAIIDWRDVDIIVSPGGAEDEYYKDLDLPYPCKNRDLEILEELLLVKGMTPEIFSKIEEVISIYGEGKVNINTANWLSLHALGFDSDLAKRIVEFRRGIDGEDGTEDDNIFKTIGELRNIGPLFTEESQQINRIISLNVLTVRSDVFRINSAGILKNGSRNLQRNIVCIVQRRKEKNPQILYWHE